MTEHDIFAALHFGAIFCRSGERGYGTRWPILDAYCRRSTTGNVGRLEGRVWLIPLRRLLIGAVPEEGAPHGRKEYEKKDQRDGKAQERTALGPHDDLRCDKIDDHQRRRDSTLSENEYSKHYDERDLDKQPGLHQAVQVPIADNNHDGSQNGREYRRNAAVSDGRLA